jgi:hypothetical protein
MPTRGIVKKSKPAPKKKTPKPKKTKNMASSSSVSADVSGAVYFWHPEDNNGFMSQWYEAPFKHEGTEYSTAEMWMMVQKAKLFKDDVRKSLTDLRYSGRQRRHLMTKCEYRKSPTKWLRRRIRRNTRLSAAPSATMTKSSGMSINCESSRRETGGSSPQAAMQKSSKLSSLRRERI